MGFRSYIRQYRPFLWVSEITLGSFWSQFWCFSVLQGPAVWAWRRRHFWAWKLGSFWSQFWRFSVLHCHGSSRMGKHHGSEGRKSVKIATKNSLISKLRFPSSETAPPPRSNSRALKDGKASKLRPKTAQKRRLRHAQTAGPWRTEKHQNCDQKSA